MAHPTPPAHLPGSLPHYETRRGVVRRLHNRRVMMLITPEGDYQIQIAKALAPGEAAELRRLGHRDAVDDFILRDRARYSIVQLTAEAFEAAVSCYEQLKGRRQRKK
ncbi:hypothetical protein [Hymenobacter sp. B1770]|uniref:hypothetical protein n=1 Tax=Hymenobacter sp. B1770 TaxID=1718788 RepID=UPI003CEE82C6